MDRKTLEYLENRAKQGREIVGKIDELTKVANRITNSGSISFSDDHGNYLGRLNATKCQGYKTQPRAVKSIVSAVISVIADEIILLEKELAEL